MLLIRDEQIEVLLSYKLKQFEDLMVEHLNTYYPGKCERLGDKAVREAIQYGIEKANTYTIHIEYDVSRYINLMFTFGRDFDTDPNYPWASGILNDEDSISTRKMDELYAASEKYVVEEK